MWRVALSAIAILIDLAILFLVVTSLPTLRVDLSDNPTAGPAHASPGGIVVVVVVMALLGLNILAILFGARVRRPDSHTQAVARFFE
jgi:hypothetical protein